MTTWAKMSIEERKAAYVARDKDFFELWAKILSGAVKVEIPRGL